MTRHLEQIGRLIRAAETQGPVRFVTGVTAADPDAGRITVDIGGRIVPATIPGSFRAALAAGQDVRLSVQGMLYTIDSVLSALDAPTVPEATAPPSAADAPEHYLDAGFVTSGTGWAFTAAEWELAGYANYLADRLAETNVTLSSLINTVTDMKDTVDSLRSALAAQGHVT